MSGPKSGGYLAPGLRALVAHVASRLGEMASVIEAQASAATVLVASPTMLDLEVPDTEQAIPLADGPLPVRAIVHDISEQPVGEILVWVKTGMLIGLEQAWFTDEPPTEWPSLESVRLR